MADGAQSQNFPNQNMNGSDWLPVKCETCDTVSVYTTKQFNEQL